VTSPIPQQKLAELRAALLAEQQELADERERLMEAVRAYTQDSEGHGDYGDNPADQATEVFEQEKDLALVDALTARSEQVAHALRRMDEGTYGICEVCGQPIPIERLEALPSATLCIRDANNMRGRA